MKIGMVTLGDNVPSTRFRFFPFRKQLESRGHRCRVWTSRPSVYDYYPKVGWRVSHFYKRSVRRLQLLDCRYFRPDCVYLERYFLHDESLDLEHRLRKLTPRLVLDVDDGIFLTFPDKVKKLIAMSDHIVVSNQPILEFVRPLHDHITIVPTCVDLDKYTVRPTQQTNQRPVIGWIGTAPNVAFLNVCAGSLRELAEDVDYELLVVAPERSELDRIDLCGVTIRFEKWSPNTESQLLHQMDIGIMPLPEGQEWMRYKAATKLIQYLAMGIPAVASPIGVNEDILRDDQVGYAARDEQDWTASLRKLLFDSELRQQLGSNGRRLVESNFSVQANLEKLESVLSGNAPQDYRSERSLL